MRVERWNPAIHLELLSEWLRGRDQAPGAGEPGLYPPTGFVVERCAVGFLYVTNAPLVAYMDGVVTDPSSSMRQRFHAIDRLCAELLKEADRCGIELVFVSTNVKGLIDICKRNGCVTYATGFECMVRVRS